MARWFQVAYSQEAEVGSARHAGIVVVATLGLLAEADHVSLYQWHWVRAAECPELVP